MAYAYGRVVTYHHRISELHEYQQLVSVIVFSAKRESVSDKGVRWFSV